MRPLVLLFVLASSAAAAAGDQAPANGSTGGPAAFTVMHRPQRLANEGRPSQRVDFPDIVDWRSLKITLAREVCMGRCPIYRVEIRGDGAVTYHGDNYVAVGGTHRATIPQWTVRKLFRAFREGEFFWLLDDYTADITDLPTYRVGIAFDAHAKTVTDYAGPAVGMPAIVSELEEEIDRAARTRKWVGGDISTFASLKDEGWDFHATDEEHLDLIVSAAQSGSADLLKDLLDAGVRADNVFGCRALSFAAEHGDERKAAMLLAAHAPVQAEDNAREGPCRPLISAASGAVPRIVKLLLDAHADPNARSFRGATALLALADNEWSPSEVPRQDYAETGQLLIAAGADVNLRGEDGESALMKTHLSADLAQVLLKAGAVDLNARDRRYRTPLMESEAPAVTTALLEAGADPCLEDGSGKTALDLAQDWQKTAPVLKAWMAAHPPK